MECKKYQLYKWKKITSLNREIQFLFSTLGLSISGFFNSLCKKSSIDSGLEEPEDDSSFLKHEIFHLCKIVKYMFRNVHNQVA